MNPIDPDRNASSVSACLAAAFRAMSVCKPGTPRGPSGPPTPADHHRCDHVRRNRGAAPFRREQVGEHLIGIDDGVAAKNACTDPLPSR
jgi:hypothetical protein